VPFEVAQDVGKLRSEIAAFIHAEFDDKAIAKKLQAKYPVARNAVLELIRLLRDHVEGGFPLPDADTIVIEDEGDAVTLNACFGHNTNGAPLPESLPRSLQPASGAA
jgi:ATP-dependent Lhr-like helicase